MADPYTAHTCRVQHPPDQECVDCDHSGDTKHILNSVPYRKTTPGHNTAYRCPMGHETIVHDRDDGLAPVIAACAGACFLGARSDLGQPDDVDDLDYVHEWYRPDGRQVFDLSPLERLYVRADGLMLMKHETPRRVQNGIRSREVFGRMAVWHAGTKNGVPVNA